MNHRRHASFRNITASIALATVAALSLAGCSGGGKPTPQTSAGAKTSSTSVSVSPAALKDESAAVLGWAPPAPVVKTEGHLTRGYFANAVNVPATAEIISVKASDESTILTWQLSSATDIPIQTGTLATYDNRGWPDAVRLVDPVGKKSYAVNTMSVPPFTYCVCSRYPLHVGPDPVRMTSEYPALPATATTVSVRIPNFAPVTVPVTR